MKTAMIIAAVGLCLAPALFSQTPLLNAAKNGKSSAAIAQAIKSTKDLNAKDADGETALLILCQKPTYSEEGRGGAADTESLESIQALLAAGADPNIPDESGVTPLMAARDCLTVKALLAAKADPNYKDPDGNGVLEMQLREISNRPDIAAIMRALIAAKVEVSGPALSIVAWDMHRGCLESAKALIASGADPNGSGDGSAPPLCAAVGAGYKNIRMVKLLLAAKADINKADSGGNTPLMTAIGAKDERMAKFLIDAKAQVDYARPDLRSTALHDAVSKKVAATIKDLIAAGANVNASTKFGETPIFSAVGNHDQATVKELIAAGADVNARTSYGETPIFRVCDDAEMARILVAAKADLKVKSKQGDTALITIARLWKNPEVFKALLDGGADKAARNDEKKTAYDFALSNKAPAALLSLLK